MGRCVYACNGDRNCEADCNDDFRQRQLECPCEVDKVTSMLVTNIGEGMCSLQLLHVDDGFQKKIQSPTSTNRRQL